MRNVTISMDDDLALRTRVAAAKEGKSMSRFLAEAAREKIEGKSQETSGNPQLEAIERFLVGPKLRISENGRMPTAEERNARR